MDEFDLPIFKKNYELYKLLYGLKVSISKQDRYTLWQRVENTSLDIVEMFFEAITLYKEEKVAVLQKASLKLDLLRFFIRLAHETKVIDGKKYTTIQQQIDEVGRMLGGWIKSILNPKNVNQNQNENENQKAPE